MSMYHYKPYYYQNFIREIPVLIIWLHLWIVVVCVYVVCLCSVCVTSIPCESRHSRFSKQDSHVCLN